MGPTGAGTEALLLYDSGKRRVTIRDSCLTGGTSGNLGVVLQWRGPLGQEREAKTERERERMCVFVCERLRERESERATEAKRDGETLRPRG